MLKEKGHLSPFEFGTIYLTIEVDSPMYDADYIPKISSVQFYQKNPYSKVITECSRTSAKTRYYITTNLRVLIENDELDDLIYATEITKHLPRYCFRLITSRDISHEFVRHRSINTLVA